MVRGRRVTSMHCIDTRELLSDYVSGDVDAALTVSIDNHLERCSECRGELAGLRAVWSALGSMERVEPGPFFRENLLTRMERDPDGILNPSRRSSRWWTLGQLLQARSLAFAAAALVLVMAGAEVVQTQRAELGPISWLVHQLMPSQPTAAHGNSAEWTTGPKGGILIVRLYNLARLDGAGHPVTYHVSVDGRADGPAVRVTSSGWSTRALLPLATPPAGKSVQVHIVPTDGSIGISEQTLSLPLDRSADGL